MQKQKKPCFFCGRAREAKIVAESEHWFARLDDKPVSRGHILIFPKRHFSSIMEATDEEGADLIKILAEVDQIVRRRYKASQYNFGFNYGENAGQGHGHLHGHFIPRRKGDVSYNPQGGIRWVIPHKAPESAVLRPKS